MAFKIYIMVLLVFSLANLVFFIFYPLKYHLSLRTLRKTLYTLFIGAISTGLLMDELQLSNWEFILTLTAIVIFMDLAILLTPSIMKIWSAEFQYTDYVEDIIKTNDKIHKAMVYRVEAVSEIIQKNNELLSPLRGYTEQELKNYLDMYAEKFGFNVQIHRVRGIEFSADDVDPAVKGGLAADEIQALVEAYRLTEGIRMTVEQIKTINNFDLNNEEEDVESLAQSAVVSLVDDESMLVPVFMNTDQFIIVLKKEMGDVLEVDAIHITNLIYLFYSL
ncbi:type II toxin-antitoxin system SpoIISA family toxin [Rossellomorea vietnamensis]|uniref:Type II toxin-antitoxin system SpoIISA family toxin n=1 Tax=Rossellomorea vietnamensis TaxID=218284 RepID=A0ACD4CCK1_9BACI|nr:type II toxin-antitoxin system SpoIISA family toxin [Rossellomorea vietnamensis]UXH46409.1 type II toxin-antitoxin system SpoIISA family toxin [Rossellomorea vietnamensis]